jgi:TPR repeat protein
MLKSKTFRAWFGATLLTCAISCGEALSAQEKQYSTVLSPVDYRIGIGDQIAVEVWRHPELTKTVVVNRHGNITLPSVKHVKALAESLVQQSDGGAVTHQDEPRNAEAQYQLGLKYARGAGVTRDDALAATLFRKAAEQGHADAQAALGFAYHLGRGVPQSDAEAVTWLRKAAEQGFAHAENNLGIMYARGRGVRQDFAEAVKWYRKAAEQGSQEAQTSLGELCANGDGTPKDPAEAVKWFRKAAEQGYAEAQTNLGRMYASGRGVSRDTVEAYMWFSLSTTEGNGEAQSSLSELAKRMTPAQIAEGGRRANAWLAQHARQ